MAITQLKLENFTAFENAELTFSHGINVIIGQNSTGKTHVMKLLYAFAKVCEKATSTSSNGWNKVDTFFEDKLNGVFQPEDAKLGRLVRRGQGRNKSTVRFSIEGEEFSYEISTLSKLSGSSKKLPSLSKAIYLPPHEFLSLYEGFTSAYLNRESSFDETYFDLSVALGSLPLRGPRLAEVDRLMEPIRDELGKIKVSQEDGRFYVRLPEGKIEANLVSEGVKKLAQLLYLISNGSILQNGILFWDEPEANLNPKYIKVVVQLLKALASSGVQIFVATHDYLLSQELSLLAEYFPSEPHIRFFSFFRNGKLKKSPVDIEMGDSLVEIENNIILDEFVAHYDLESELFRKAQLLQAEG